MACPRLLLLGLVLGLASKLVSAQQQADCAPMSPCTVLVVNVTSPSTMTVCAVVNPTSTCLSCTSGSNTNQCAEFRTCAIKSVYGEPFASDVHAGLGCTGTCNLTATGITPNGVKDQEKFNNCMTFPFTWGGNVSSIWHYTARSAPKCTDTTAGNWALAATNTYARKMIRCPALLNDTTGVGQLMAGAIGCNASDASPSSQLITFKSNIVSNCWQNDNPDNCGGSNNGNECRRSFTLTFPPLPPSLEIYNVNFRVTFTSDATNTTSLGLTAQEASLRALAARLAAYFTNPSSIFPAANLVGIAVQPTSFTFRNTTTTAFNTYTTNGAVSFLVKKDDTNRRIKIDALTKYLMDRPDNIPVGRKLLVDGTCNALAGSNPVFTGCSSTFEMVASALDIFRLCDNTKINQQGCASGFAAIINATIADGVCRGLFADLPPAEQTKSIALSGSFEACISACVANLLAAAANPIATATNGTFTLKPNNQYSPATYITAEAYDSKVLVDRTSRMATDPSYVVSPPQTVFGVLAPVDWTSFFGPASNQGACASCWIHAAHSALQAQLYMSFNNLHRAGPNMHKLSFEQFSQCTPNFRSQFGVDANGEDYACRGGLPVTALKMAASRFVYEDREYKWYSMYQPKPEGTAFAGQKVADPRAGGTLLSCVEGTDCVVGSCNKNAWVSDYQPGYYDLMVRAFGSVKRITPNNPSAIKDALNRGPLVALVNALCINVKYYSSGYLDDYTQDCVGLLNHAVVIVGWGNTTETGAPTAEYWIVRNSWGAGWGQNGYAKWLINPSYLPEADRLTRNPGAAGLHVAVWEPQRGFSPVPAWFRTCSLLSSTTVQFGTPGPVPIGGPNAQEARNAYTTFGNITEIAVWRNPTSNLLTKIAVTYGQRTSGLPYNRTSTFTYGFDATATPAANVTLAGAAGQMVQVSTYTVYTPSSGSGVYGFTLTASDESGNVVWTATIPSAAATVAGSTPTQGAFEDSDGAGTRLAFITGTLSSSTNTSTIASIAFGKTQCRKPADLKAQQCATLRCYDLAACASKLAGSTDSTPGWTALNRACSTQQFYGNGTCNDGPCLDMQSQPINTCDPIREEGCFNPGRFRTCTPFAFRDAPNTPGEDTCPAILKYAIAKDDPEPSFAYSFLSNQQLTGQAISCFISEEHPCVTLGCSPSCTSCKVGLPFVSYGGRRLAQDAAGACGWNPAV